ncbi:Pentatricopeptide repeat-containing protein [Ananas comosus]|uniref:Pentatricopeptide repeat-containing protein n=1 Tax=Ananas comosus TaxID=4615 RepID=A0A199VB63_ANACO|nr:Pentatricopeptide repeat-containing protein [Ananas comosus]
MAQSRPNGVAPNGVTVACVLQACSQLKELLFGMGVHRYAVENGVEMDITVWNSIIGFYAKCGSLDYARNLFDEMPMKDGVSYSAMISGYMNYGRVSQAMELFWQVESPVLSTWNAAIAGLFQNSCHSEVLELPDQVTFTAVLTGSRAVFDAMSPLYGISPAVEHYACMAGALSLELIEKMPFDPNEKVWGALLSGAAVFGDVKIGRRAFDRLCELEPENTGNYILMANLYSKDGRWEEAKLVREKMRVFGLGKVPGCSWIEPGIVQI